MIKPHTFKYKIQYVQRVINHGLKDIQYEYIDEEKKESKMKISIMKKKKGRISNSRLNV